MPASPVYRIVVFLSDWEVEASEPMSEEVARAEFASLYPQVRTVKSPSRMIRIGPNVLVRAGDIRRVKLVKLGDDDGFDGEIGDESTECVSSWRSRSRSSSSRSRQRG